jgi:sulfur carrier protein ThiS
LFRVACTERYDDAGWRARSGTIFEGNGIDMSVYLPDGTIMVPEGSPVPVGSLLLSLGINPLEVIVTKNGKLIPEDAVISCGDEVKVFRVAHGG